jgi:hypothetical protein
LWYPRHQLQKRIGFFFGAATLAGAFSGILAYGISFMSGIRGYLGWSWIFVRLHMDRGPEILMFSEILEGLATIVVGLVALFSKDVVLTLICFYTENHDSLGGFPSDRRIPYTR